MNAASRSALACPEEATGALGQDEQILMGRNRRGFRMKLSATGRDLFGVTAPDYNRLKGCFSDQCNFSLFIDAQIATIPPLACQESAKILASCPILKGQTRRTAAAFS